MVLRVGGWVSHKRKSREGHSPPKSTSNHLIRCARAVVIARAAHTHARTAFVRACELSRPPALDASVDHQFFFYRRNWSSATCPKLRRRTCCARPSPRTVRCLRSTSQKRSGAMLTSSTLTVKLQNAPCAISTPKPPGKAGGHGQPAPRRGKTSVCCRSSAHCFGGKGVPEPEAEPGRVVRPF